VGLVALTLKILNNFDSEAYTVGLLLTSRFRVVRVGRFKKIGSTECGTMFRVKLVTNFPIGLKFVRSCLRCSMKLDLETNIWPKCLINLPSMSSSLCVWFPPQEVLFSGSSPLHVLFHQRKGVKVLGERKTLIIGS